MSKDDKNLSRRKFISTGAAVAGAASIIAIENLAAPNAGAKTVTPFAPLPTNDPVYTESTQTLTNKTIPSRQNILGTDYVNVREYAITGTDITSALNSAISALSASAYGGQILIPHGVWTTNGGHEFGSSISIEGVGFNPNPGYWGTELKLNANQSGYVFRMSAVKYNCSLKNLAIDLRSNSSAIGLLMTNHNSGTVTGGNIYFTSLENVGFNGGAYGIKVESKDGTQFECILNRFERLSFIGCQTAFYCNSINGGYSFDTCYFAMPANGIALECVYIGNLAAEHCLFVGGQVNEPWVPASDGTTILKTTGAYNNISFYDCQDENVQYAYRNTSNHYDYVPLVYRNCLIQSKLKFTANGSAIFEACRFGVSSAGAIEDTSTAYARIYLKGTNNFYTSSADLGGPIGTFVNAYSQVIYESKEVGLPVITTTTATSYTINATRGTVNIGTGVSYVVVYNNFVTADSLVFAQLRTYDSGGARIREVQCFSGYFMIALTAYAATTLSVAFKIEI
jgi:hypothetical protein